MPTAVLQRKPLLFHYQEGPESLTRGRGNRKVPLRCQAGLAHDAVAPNGQGGNWLLVGPGPDDLPLVACSRRVQQATLSIPVGPVLRVREPRLSTLLGRAPVTSGPCAHQRRLSSLRLSDFSR